MDPFNVCLQEKASKGAREQGPNGIQEGYEWKSQMYLWAWEPVNILENKQIYWRSNKYIGDETKYIGDETKYMQI